jgi:hypothetical protein
MIDIYILFDLLKVFLESKRVHQKKLKEQEKKTKLLNEKQTQTAKEKKKKMEKDGLLQKDEKVRAHTHTLSFSLTSEAQHQIKS